ncbi:hypothetical protein EW146_g922 [Bondarzewia mesenterica]|uniref:Conserved oligomeric Golgi complex subunit 2 n=1 Tax=Bondarzewia mesenterica TaxID=1095465 RepID=A0A4S4M5G6_9AGAM|nr:hypothetical protein EW146_g922 [Bondarzewia mesenterica]
MSSGLGVPVKLLHESLGHIITVELKTGQLYRGKLAEAEDNLNISLKDITVTGRDGRVSQLDQVYIRGSMVRFFIVPDMLQNAPMFKRVGPNAMRGRGIGTARGRATIMRANARRGRGVPAARDMALQSPSVASSSSRDPFELERLAEELAARESSHSFSFSNGDPSDLDLLPTHDLPIYAPLSHTNPFFTAETFNVEEFLLSRSHTSLQDLRSELRDYHAALKEELVKLINDDYEAFISLSTDLKGEGLRLERLKVPSGGSQDSDSRTSCQAVSVVSPVVLKTKLKKRSALRDEKAFLHLLLKISESVTRLESLLLISSPDSASSPGLGPISLSKSGSGHDVNGHDERVRGNRAKHLARVATEYTQLLYHVKKAQDEQQSAFVDEVQWRVDRIKSTLSSDLDHLFAATVSFLTGVKESKLNDVEKAKRMADLSECLRIYDILGLWRDAEDVLRREVMREFVKKSIYPGAMTVPQTPLLPQTPLPVRNFASATHTNASPHLPRTPYTPFTAFASKQNPFESTFTSAHLLDDADNSLGGLYNAVLKFVQRDMKRIMDLADKVSVKHGARVAKGVVNGSASSVPPQLSSGDGDTFEFMANVVWAEVGRAIMDELGSVVFAAGNPGEFRKNHETTQAFIRSLQYLAPSVHSVQAMIAHPVYTAFERRWQLPIYFQLRWKEIVTKLEDSLATTKIEPSSSKDLRPFVMSQSAAIWVAITTCWSGEVYIPELGHRFWKLTLQLLSRYRTWLESSLPRVEPLPKFSASEKTTLTPAATPPSTTRASTPNPPTESSLVENAAVDDALLRQCAAAVNDIKAMQSETLTLWHEEISMMLPDMSEIADDQQVSSEDALQHTLQGLISLVPPLSSQIVAILTKRACEALMPVRSIPSQFRAMSNKRPPTEPSYFVASILRPLKVFFAIGTAEGPGSSLRADYLRSYSEEIFENVVQRYIHYLTAMKKTEESLKRLKKGKKSTFSLFGNAAGKEDDNRDEERIRTQMILDVEAFGKDAESLQVDVRGSASFKSLSDMVNSSLTDGMSSGNFRA